jgi:aspartate carbamoyltransferase
MKFKNRDIITTENLSRDDLLEIMKVTADMEKLVQKEKVSDLMSDKLVAVIFLEPSTRTRLSFVTAVHRVGARPVIVSEAKSSSQAKGETLEDTGKTVEGYVDCIVIRQPQIGGAQRIADAVEVPVINGGDGSGQHPTQALLDLYTIQKEKQTLEGLKVAMVGDLKFGRTVHSLSYALAPFEPQYIYCSPDALRMPETITSDMRAKGITVEETADIRDAVQADIVYMTRVQRERFDDPAEYERLKGSYILDRELVESGRKGLTVMHPLPRVDEIATDVDELPNAAYFRQAHNGVYLRMALLAMVTGAV